MLHSPYGFPPDKSYGDRFYIINMMIIDTFCCLAKDKIPYRPRLQSLFFMLKNYALPSALPVPETPRSKKLRMGIELLVVILE